MNHPSTVPDDYAVRQDEASVVFTYREATAVSTYRVFPGVLLGFNRIRTRELPPVFPSTALFTSRVMLRVNFSMEGICELYTHDGNYVYIKGGNVVISREQAAMPFGFPSGTYDGVELYILEEALTAGDEVFGYLGVDIANIEKHYLKEQPTLIANMAPDLRALGHSLVRNHEDDPNDLVRLRFNSMSILYALSAGLVRLAPLRLSALTLQQINAAKTMEKRLTRQLSVRISVAEIARDAGVSESSLKNWFKAVFGKSVSTYLRERRIEEAMRLLRETNMHISEVANAVGYESQSKFTSMFHKACHYSPSEYRKKIAEGDEKDRGNDSL